MRPIDIAIVAVCAAAGWAIVSWLFNVVRQQKAPPVPMEHTRSSRMGSEDMSLAELGRQWHLILGVSPGAEAAAVEHAYRERLAECAQLGLATSATAEQKSEAEKRRRRITQAFEFIRPTLAR